MGYFSGISHLVLVLVLVLSLWTLTSASAERKVRKIMPRWSNYRISFFFLQIIWFTKFSSCWALVVVCGLPGESSAQRRGKFEEFGRDHGRPPRVSWILCGQVFPEIDLAVQFFGHHHCNLCWCYVSARTKHETQSSTHTPNSSTGSRQSSRKRKQRKYRVCLSSPDSLIASIRLTQILIYSLAETQGVLAVFPNKARKLQTTRSWQFLGLESDGVVPADSLWTQARYGEDTIIGNFDTGAVFLFSSSPLLRWLYFSKPLNFTFSWPISYVIRSVARIG